MRLFRLQRNHQSLKKVARAAEDMMLHDFGNPSSSHISGLSAKSILEKSQATMAGFLHCQGNEIIFTSGAAEAINTAVLSALKAEIQASRHMAYIDGLILRYH